MKSENNKSRKIKKRNISIILILKDNHNLHN